MIGYWKNKGGSKLDQIFKFAQGYAVYGKTLLMLACKHSLIPQLTSNMNVWRGPYQDAELYMVRPMKDYEERANAWLRAAGGCEKFRELSEQWGNFRGHDLMK